MTVQDRSPSSGTGFFSVISGQDLHTLSTGMPPYFLLMYFLRVLNIM